MKDVALLQPLVAWLLLVVVVAIRLATLRVREFTARRLDLQSYALRGGRAPLSDAAERAADHYQNQFEMPLAFVTTCVGVQLAGFADGTYVALAWIYVLLRMVHSVVHLAYNRVYHRFLAFVASFAVLAIMVVRLAWQLFSRGM